MINENRTRNYLLYAVGEIVLVMIGILLALQVNNWNEERKDRIKERAILNQLHGEFSKNLEEFLPVKQNQINTLNNGAIVFRNIDDLEDKIARDSVYRHVVGMFGGYPYYPSNGVVESLISSGDFKLINNDTLRKYLVSWNDVLNNYEEYVEIDRAFWSENIEPYIIQNGNFLNLRSTENLALVEDLVFLNMLYRKQFFQRNIVNSISREEGLEHYLNEITRLSKPPVDD